MLEYHCMGYVVNKGFITQKAGEQIVIFDSEKSLLYTLNETAAFIFHGLKRSWSAEKIVEKVSETFIVDKAKAQEDVAKSIQDLLKKEIISKTD